MAFLSISEKPIHLPPNFSKAIRKPPIPENKSMNENRIKGTIQGINSNMKNIQNFCLSFKFIFLYSKYNASCTRSRSN